MSIPSELVELAQFMADEAGKIARQYYRQDFEIISKADETPVTLADRGIEIRLREILADKRPDDGIHGEEFGVKETTSGFTWVIDPIDGTKSFTIGRPTFGTLIGLCQDEEPVLGIIDQAVSMERWIGIKGQATTFNNSIVTTRKCNALDQAIFGTGSPSQIERNDPQRFARFDKECRYTVYQGDCYFYGLMANGAIDLLVEDYLGLYDYIALVPIIEGAGGMITDWSGAKLTLASGSNLLAAGDPKLHAKALALL
ncbi:MAG: histidinol phosphate phosphatase [Micavibrio aeruginosavorus]|uniref:Histidinol phosphate phosphatase n=1 Tax=Micavibrio aeruginosavorus TaxID=349221 RepID=A0A2W5FGF5_9BACT|nr:MAG: histidinol phosphate phosphatase [Micavibrio aeruginosavorus]